MIETPLLMGAESTLFGVCTEPDAANGCGVIILNSGLLHHVGPYRLHVTLARALREIGCHAIRLDLSGKGESPSRKGLSSYEALLKDFDDTVLELEKRGVSSFFLVGLCSGADDALFIAQHRTNLSGLVLLDGYAGRTKRFLMNHYLPRMLKVGPWLRALQRIINKILLHRSVIRSKSINEIRDWFGAADMKACYAKAFDNGISMLAIFTGGIEYYNYHGQLAEFLDVNIERHRLKEVYYQEAGHTFSQVVLRLKLVEEICNWVELQMQMKF